MKIFTRVFFILPLFVSATVFALSDLEKGDQAFQNQQYGKAEKYYRVALRADNNNSSILLRIAQCETNLGKVDNAFETVNKVLELNATYPDGYVLRGQLFSMKGDWIRARIDYQAAVVQDPNHRGARAGLAQSLKMLGDEDGADAQYDALRDIEENQ